MAAGEHNFDIEQGADFLKTIRWKRGDGLPVDLTGYTARMQGREFFESPIVLLDLTTSNGGIVIDGPSGVLHLVMTAEQTAALSWSRVRYDIELVSATGHVTRLLFGRIRLSREVTRET